MTTDREESIMFFDTRGTEIISHPRPPKGTVYIGISNPARHPSTKS
jgi:putative transposase